MPQESASRPPVLITGSSGFLGQAIAKGLLDRYLVIGLDVRKPTQPIEGMATVEIDLTSDESVDAAMKEAADKAGGRIASVIHLAAYYNTTGEDNPKYEAVTVEGSRRLLEALKAVGTEQFVFSSTLLVHSPSPEKPEGAHGGNRGGNQTKKDDEPKKSSQAAGKDPHRGEAE